MEPKPQIAERAAALLKQVSANDVRAISGGTADTPPAPPIVTNAVSPTINDEEFAATAITVYENIVQSTSEFIERVLGPYNSEP